MSTCGRCRPELAADSPSRFRQSQQILKLHHGRRHTTPEGELQVACAELSSLPSGRHYISRSMLLEQSPAATWQPPHTWRNSDASDDSFSRASHNFPFPQALGATFFPAFSTVRFLGHFLDSLPDRSLADMAPSSHVVIASVTVCAVVAIGVCYLCMRKKRRDGDGYDGPGQPSAGTAAAGGAAAAANGESRVPLLFSQDWGDESEDIEQQSFPPSQPSASADQQAAAEAEAAEAARAARQKQWEEERRQAEAEAAEEAAAAAAAANKRARKEGGGRQGRVKFGESTVREYDAGEGMDGEESAEAAAASAAAAPAAAVPDAAAAAKKKAARREGGSGAGRMEPRWCWIGGDQSVAWASSGQQTGAHERMRSFTAGATLVLEVISGPPSGGKLVLKNEKLGLGSLGARATLVLEVISGPASGGKLVLKHEHLEWSHGRPPATIGRSRCSLQVLTSTPFEISIPTPPSSTLFSHSGATLVLEVISGPASGGKLVLKNEKLEPWPSATIGRVKANDLQLNDGEVSSKHAYVTWNALSGRWEVVDRGSLNGMLLNDEAINAEADEDGERTEGRDLSGRWEVVDRGSLNGTLLNDEAINAEADEDGERTEGRPCQLADGDVITCGSQSRILTPATGRCPGTPCDIAIAADPMRARKGGKPLPSRAPNTMPSRILSALLFLPADPMRARKGGKPLPMEDVPLCEWPLRGLQDCGAATAASSKGGKPRPMEDVPLCEWPLRGLQDMGICCVFDGHAGRQCADNVKRIFPEKLSQELLKGGKHVVVRMSCPRAPQGGKHVVVRMSCNATDVLRAAFKATEEELNNEDEGCTATVLLVWRAFQPPHRVWVQAGNLGDSHCVLGLGSASEEGVVQMTEDHRLTGPVEKGRLASIGKPMRDGDTRLCAVEKGRLASIGKPMRDGDTRLCGAIKGQCEGLKGVWRRGAVGLWGPPLAHTLHSHRFPAHLPLLFPNAGMNIARVFGDKFLKQQDVGLSSDPFIHAPLQLPVPEEGGTSKPVIAVIASAGGGAGGGGFDGDSRSDPRIGSSSRVVSAREVSRGADAEGGISDRDSAELKLRGSSVEVDEDEEKDDADEGTNELPAHALANADAISADVAELTSALEEEESGLGLHPELDVEGLEHIIDMGRRLEGMPRRVQRFMFEKMLKVKPGRPPSMQRLKRVRVYIEYAFPSKPVPPRFSPSLLPTASPLRFSPPLLPSASPLRFSPPLLPSASPLRFSPPLLPSASPLRFSPPLLPSASPLRFSPPLLPSASPLRFSPPLLPSLPRYSFERQHS
ncbi:unnamed protein product, partial [Closterium sp. Naga37s-1]